MVKQPENRLGSKSDFEDIKSHSWFKNIDWEGILIKKVYKLYPRNIFMSLKDKTAFQTKN